MTEDIRKAIVLKPGEGMTIRLYAVTNEGNHMFFDAEVRTGVKCAVHSLRVEKILAPVISMEPPRRQGRSPAKSRKRTFPTKTTSRASGQEIP